MKKLLLLIACVSFTNMSEAQFTKKSLLLGGTISYSSTKTTIGPDTYKESQFAFAPLLLYMASDNFGLGVTVNQSSGRTNDGNDELKSSDFVFGPCFRFQSKWKERFSGYGQFNILFGSGKYEEMVTIDRDTLPDLIVKNTAKYSATNFSFFPGINYQLGKSFFLDARYGLLSVGTRKPKESDSDDDKVSNFELSLGISTLQIGAILKF